MRRTITLLCCILIGAGALLWFRHRPEGSTAEQYSKWDAEMDAFGPRLIGDRDDIGPYRPVPYFFDDIGQAAVAKPIPGLPVNHPLGVAEANLSMGIYRSAARTALEYVGTFGENYDPSRQECRAAASILASLYTETEHVPVLPLGLFWGGTLLGDLGREMRTSYAERTVPHPRLPHCTIHCYRLERAGPPPVENQPLVFVLRDKGDFVGAFCVERNQKTKFFELKFVDYEGLSLAVEKLGPDPPEEIAVVEFLHEFTPSYPPWSVPSYSVMRAEVEALVHSRNEATPLAARWAAYARLRREGQPQDSAVSIVATAVREKLRSRRAWSWKIESDDDAGEHFDARYGRSVPAYRVQGYRNMSLEDAGESALSKLDIVEHYHFTVFSTARGFPRHEYLFSYRLVSRVEDGTRQIALEQLEAGIPMWIQSFDGVPSFEAVRTAVVDHLESSETRSELGE
jgi:hypothetical protein